MTPPTRSFVIAEKAPAKSRGARASSSWSCTFSNPAATFASLSSRAWYATVGFESTATREIPGIASLSSCSRLPASSGAAPDIPVILPPGLGRLATSPLPTGSL